MVGVWRGEREGREDMNESSNLPSPMYLISPLGVPSCFTPTMQQRCMGWEAILVE